MDDRFLRVTLLIISVRNIYIYMTSPSPNPDPADQVVVKGDLVVEEVRTSGGRRGGSGGKGKK